MTDTKRIGDYAAHTQLMEILECTPDVHEGYTTADGTHIGEEIIPDNSETEYRAAVIAGTKEFPIAYIDAKECFKLFKNRPLEIKNRGRIFTARKCARGAESCE